MNRPDSATLRRAITKYWRTKSDEELSKGMNASVEEVKRLREELGFKGESLKEFARKYLLNLTEKEKKDFLARLPPELVWRMSEGSPATSGEININNEPIRIDITHQLLKVYGPKGISHIEMPTNSEGTRLAQRSGE